MESYQESVDNFWLLINKGTSLKHMMTTDNNGYLPPCINTHSNSDVSQPV